MSRLLKSGLRVAAGVCVLAIILLIVVLFLPRLPSTDLADEQIGEVRAALQAHPEFSNVQVYSLKSDGGGQFLISGELSGEEDFKRLQQIVEGTNPPVSVRYTVRDPETGQPWGEPPLEW